MIILAIIDSSSWPELFFWITMVLAAVINMANGVYQGCVYGSAAQLPMKFTNAVTIGMDLSGTVASLLLILTIAIAPHPQQVAIYFFSSAVFILLLCLSSYLVLKDNVIRFGLCVYIL
jgi:equilibrative nucleoside transporter 1/2/3